MMRIKLLAAVSIAIAEVTEVAPAHAEFLSGNELYKDCRNDAAAFRRSCAVTVHGRAKLVYASS
jgi:hypothetical protein